MCVLEKNVSGKPQSFTFGGNLGREREVGGMRRREKKRISDGGGQVFH